MNKDDFLEIFSDGGSVNNGHKKPDEPMYASCGIVITYNKEIVFQGSKGFIEKTISYAELKGAMIVIDKSIKLLDKLDYMEYPYNLHLYSDSQFVVKSVNEWMSNWLKKAGKNWEKNIWYNASGGEVGQQDLFKELKKKFLDNPNYNIEFNHIKGHTKNKDFYSEMNDLCDSLCTAQLEYMKPVPFK